MGKKAATKKQPAKVPMIGGQHKMPNGMMMENSEMKAMMGGKNGKKGSTKKRK